MAVFDEEDFGGHLRTQTIGRCFLRSFIPVRYLLFTYLLLFVALVRCDNVSDVKDLHVAVEATAHLDPLINDQNALLPDEISPESFLALHSNFNFASLSNNSGKQKPPASSPNNKSSLLGVMAGPRASLPQPTKNSALDNMLMNQYQVITICNTLPSILKCQNQHHFLILHRVVYGISAPTRPIEVPSGSSNGECVSQTKCNEVDDSDHFNCTGSNICIFYPSSNRQLTTCSHISNLTQIYITCVNLAFMKKFYMQRNRKTTRFPITFSSIDTSSTDPYSAETANPNEYVTASRQTSYFVEENVMNNNTSSRNYLSSNRKLHKTNSILLANDLIVSIAIGVFCTVLIILAVSTIYYRMKIKQLIFNAFLSNDGNTPPIITTMGKLSNGGGHGLPSSHVHHHQQHQHQIHLIKSVPHGATQYTAFSVAQIHPETTPSITISADVDIAEQPTNQPIYHNRCELAAPSLPQLNGTAESPHQYQDDASNNVVLSYIKQHLNELVSSEKKKSHTSIESSSSNTKSENQKPIRLKSKSTRKSSSQLTKEKDQQKYKSSVKMTNNVSQNPAVIQSDSNNLHGTQYHIYQAADARPNGALVLPASNILGKSLPNETYDMNEMIDYATAATLARDNPAVFCQIYPDYCFLSQYALYDIPEEDDLSEDATHDTSRI